MANRVRRFTISKLLDVTVNTAGLGGGAMDARALGQLNYFWKRSDANK